MTIVTLCLQVHQPHRLRPYRVFDIGRPTYFDGARDRDVMRRVADRCYLPAIDSLHRLVERHAGRFRIALALSGSALDQFERYATDVLAALRALALNDGVELLAEADGHGFGFVLGPAEFDAQVRIHLARIERLFDREPMVLRATEWCLDGVAAEGAARCGLRAVLADQVVGAAVAAPRDGGVVRLVDRVGTRLLLRDRGLGERLAARFGVPGHDGLPLSVATYAEEVVTRAEMNGAVHVGVGLETFGERQPADSGILDFLERLPAEILARGARFATPSEVVRELPGRHRVWPAALDPAAAPPLALRPWLGNGLQRDAVRELRELHLAASATGDARLIRDWRRLSASDHLLYMDTGAPGVDPVGRGFSPFDSPYDAYVVFCNVLHDLRRRVAAARLVETPVPAVPALRRAPSVRALSGHARQSSGA